MRRDAGSVVTFSKFTFVCFLFLLFIAQLLFPCDLLVNNLKQVRNQRNMQFTTLYCGSYIFNSWGVFSCWVELCHATRLDKKYNQLFSLNLSDSPQWKTSHYPIFIPLLLSFCNFMQLFCSLGQFLTMSSKRLLGMLMNQKTLSFLHLLYFAKPRLKNVQTNPTLVTVAICYIIIQAFALGG